MRFFQTFLTAPRHPFEPLVRVIVRKERILNNLAAFLDAVAPSKIAPVLKANAYGHGLVEVASILDGDPAVVFFVVDSLYEARVLRGAGIRHAILIIGYTPAREIMLGAEQFADLSFAVVSLEHARELASATREIAVHLKIDTGMNRQGLEPNELEDAARALAANEHIYVEGLCTHLAEADSSDETFTRTQIGAFRDALQAVERITGPIRYKHISATGGFRFADRMPANVFRLGLGLYGIDPAGRIGGIAPALSLETKVSHVRTVKAGESVGYDRTFVARRDTRVATIPVGYYEGVDRRLSNKGSVLIRDVACPIAGRVSMNMTTVDVSGCPECAPGDAAVVVSDRAAHPNSVQAIAKDIGAIPYEILVRIPSHLRREVV